MPALKNPRHEAFAQAVVSGSCAGEAYRKIYTKASPATAETNGPALLRTTQVKLRTEQLRLVASEKLRAATDRLIEKQAGAAATAVARIIGAALTQAEMLAFLTNAVLTPIGELDANNILTHSIETTGSLGPDAKGLPVNKLKAHDKLRAIELAAKLQGFLVEKVESTVDDKRVKSPDERARLLRESIARRQATHGAS